MAGKRYLEIKVCKYNVTGESFCSSLKQNLQKVYYELNFKAQKIVHWFSLWECGATFEYIIHESVMQDCFLE